MDRTALYRKRLDALDRALVGYPATNPVDAAWVRYIKESDPATRRQRYAEYLEAYDWNEFAMREED